MFRGKVGFWGRGEKGEEKSSQRKNLFLFEKNNEK